MSSPRFATGFTFVGEVTVTPDDRVINVGEFSLGAAEDTLWVEIQQANPVEPWPFSFGILGFETTFGNELGRQKVWPSRTPGTYRLTNYLAPSVSTGQITFEPRSYNLAWIKAGTPWTLQFYAKAGQSNIGGGDSPAFGTRATLTPIAETDGGRPDWNIRDGFARLFRN